MNDDMEPALRDMFRRHEGDALIPLTAPAPVLKRTRRRQVGNGGIG